MVAARGAFCGKCKRLDYFLLQTEIDLVMEELENTYASETGIDQSLEMKRFVWPDLEAAFTRLISETPASDVFT